MTEDSVNMFFHVVLFLKNLTCLLLLRHFCFRGHLEFSCAMILLDDYEVQTFWGYSCPTQTKVSECAAVFSLQVFLPYFKTNVFFFF